MRCSDRLTPPPETDAEARITADANDPISLRRSDVLLRLF